MLNVPIRHGVYVQASEIDVAPTSTCSADFAVPGNTLSDGSASSGIEDH